MSILESILNYKRQEQALAIQQADAVGQTIQTIVNAPYQKKLMDLQLQDLESRIQSRQPSELDQLIEKGKAADAAKILGDHKLFESITGNGAASMVNQELDPVAQITGQAAAQVDQAKALDSYVNETDPFTGKPTARAMRAEGEIKGEIQAKQASQKEVETNLGKVRRLRPIIDTIEKRYLETEPGSGVGGRAAGIKSLVVSGLQANEQQQIDASYRSFVKGIRAQLARALGDVGNLSVPEQKAAMDLVPSLMDNKETGLRKIKNLREFITNLEAGSVNKARMQLPAQEAPKSGKTKSGISYTIEE